MGLWEGIKRGADAMTRPAPPVPYIAEGLQVHCPNCQSIEFFEGKALLNTAGMTFFNLDWANREALTLMCGHCGLIQWFGGDRPTRGLVDTHAKQDIDPLE